MNDRWTWHGGGLEAAKRRFGTRDAPWIDLSTGINPYSWPHAGEIAVDWRRLPEPEALADLEAAAAACFGVHPRHCCAVPGSEIGLRLAGALIGGPARALAPAYRTHSEMVADAAPISLEQAPGHRGTLILANPNNPDGRTIAPRTMRDLLAGRADGAWLLVDEAFADAAPALSVAAEVQDDRRLIVFRSFGKFFGLAGLRLGFVLGPTSLLARLRRQLGAWPLSSAAIAVGAAAYRHREWVGAMRSRLPREAAALDAALARAGHRAVGACPLFRLIQAEDAGALFARLARQAILTRPFAENRHWLRIGLPPGPDALERLEAALRDG